MDEIEYPELEIEPDEEEIPEKVEVEDGVPPPDVFPAIDQGWATNEVQPSSGMQVQGANIPQTQIPMPPFGSFESFNKYKSPNPKPFPEDFKVSFLEIIFIPKVNDSDFVYRFANRWNNKES